ncbi:hypothetical protein BASA81_010169 [Batrachochytrium salamandrivorans]|nr:hypothetical protein BASA81_010169 [Batrachochytrium salamandrivorans]
MSEASKKLYLKSFRISGFRSYSDSKVVTLSPFCNVVVGPNGSGKSNFFAALEFVLGEREFSQLTHEQRQELLHEGDASDSVQTAFVEVVFDNSEGRLQLDTEEVVLRRSVGLKKDEFFVNGKHVPKTEISTLLESAGFSRSNPYYICRQGKVSELCTMSDFQRLALLKEVAGTNVYDSRRLDSEKLLEEAGQKSLKIDESIAGIQSRLEELQQEKEELEQFRELDREKRALEYLLSDGEIKTAQAKLEQLEKQKHDRTLEAQQLGDLADSLNGQVRLQQSQLDFVQSELNRLEADRVLLDQKLTRTVGIKTKRELDVRDYKERLHIRQDKLVATKQELAQVEDAIAQANHELDQSGGLRSQLEQCKLEVAQARELVKRREVRTEELRAKQGRHYRFGQDVDQRNAALEQEIVALKQNIASKAQADVEYEQQLDSMQQEERDKAELVTELGQRLQENDSALASNEGETIKTRELLNRTNAKKKELWKKAQTEEDEQRLKEDALKRAAQTLGEIIPFAFQSGLNALPAICQERALDYPAAVFGPLYSLVACSRPEYRTAVEVAAGNQLLHVVVDTDKTAAALMQGLVDKKAGRVTFKPLNVLTQREQQASKSSSHNEDEDGGGDEGGGGAGTLYELEVLKKQLAQDRELQQHDAFPLIDKLVFKPELGPAVRVMMGKTLLCRNNQVAVLCSKKYNVDCVTLDGDQVSRRGALTGGYVDVKRSRLGASEEIAKTTKALAELVENNQGTKSQAKQEEQTGVQLSGELQRLERDRGHLQSTKQNLVLESKRTARALEQAKERMEQMVDLAAKQAATGSSVRELETRVGELEEEKRNPSTVTAAEQQELTSLPALLDQAKHDEKRLALAEQELRSSVLALKTDLQENLCRRRDELQVVLESSSNAAMTTTTTEDSQGNEGGSAAELELEAVALEEQELKAELEVLENKVQEKRDALLELGNQLAANKESESDTNSKLDQAHSQVEAVHRKQDEFVLKNERASRKLRDVGNLPQSELDKYKHLPEPALGSMLAQTNLKLKKFSSVNKKALDQFVSFSEQKQALVVRQTEAKEADVKIRDLIYHLDRAKDDAIILTFKHVAHNFREIFLELVPGGTAELRMVKGSNSGEEGGSEEESEGEDEGKSKVSAFVGISPRVSFTASSETVPMKQLSGGQKALVALTIMFAIQRSDQAPFYLFDEIDQALDSNHRTAVAALIQRQAKSKTRSAQFVTTTFRPEMVLVADRCLGIHFSQKVSSIGPIDKNQALKFIRQSGDDGHDNNDDDEGEEEDLLEEEEEEQPKKRASKGTSSSSRKRSKH